MLRVGLDSRHKLDRLLSHYAEPLDIPDGMAEVKKCLSQAQINLRQARKESTDHRKSMLADRIVAASMQQDPEKKKAAQRIEKAEAMKALHAKLKFISRDGDPNNNLNHLEVPQDPTQDPKRCTSWMTVDTPEETTTYLLERNTKHFSQAQGTRSQNLP